MHNDITSEAQADRLIDSDQPAWLFKHSSACPISAGAIRRFRAFLDEHPDETAGVVTVQSHRPVSNHVAERLAVQHQTPQLLLVRSGTALWHASHGDISVNAMEEAREQHA